MFCDRCEPIANTSDVLDIFLMKLVKLVYMKLETKQNPKFETNKQSICYREKTYLKKKDNENSI